MSKTTGIYVIGSGPAGYGAAKQLVENGIETNILEKNSFFGGHCASFKFDEGFIFDDGPHISFTKIEDVKNIFAKNAGNDVSEFCAYVDNYWHGHRIKHPAITSMHGLPSDLNTKILLEVTDAIYNKENNSTPANYEEWLIQCYGDTYARQFPMEYTIKYHTTEAKNMTTDWLGPRLYQPELEEVIFGMLSPESPDKHYISDFRYPNKEGFSNFLSETKTIAPIHFKNEVTEIDVQNKTFCINNNQVLDYTQLISSMPLPVLINRIKNAPADLVAAANRLACSKAIIVNLGINKPDISKAHWTYIYDQDICFARLSFPHMFSRSTVPSGCSAVQAELYYSDKYRPLDITLEQAIDDTIRDLIKVGVIESRKDVIFEKAWVAPWAQVIFDHDRKEAVDSIHSFLREHDIEYCGRFGDWAYIWSDESFISGREAAKRVIDKNT